MIRTRDHCQAVAATLALACLLAAPFALGDEAAARPQASPDPALDHTAAVSPIDQSLLLRYLADNSTFTLIDARSEQEFDVGHILGAVNVPHDAVDEFSVVLPEDVDAPLVVYCRTGKRAAKLAEALTLEGYTNVRVLGPAQLFWSDSAPMFNCGVPTQAEPSFVPARVQRTAAESTAAPSTITSH